MADLKITQLTADASPTLDDVIVTVNDPLGVPANRQVTLANLKTLILASGWTTYDCSPAGWAATPTQTTSRYLVIGRICYLRIDVTGTSNATTTTVQQPVQAVNADNLPSPWGFAQDNGGVLTAPGAIAIRSANLTIDIYKDMADAAWTATGTKRVAFMAFYEI